MRRRKQINKEFVVSYLIYVTPYILSFVYAATLTSVTAADYPILALAGALMLGGTIHVIAHAISKCINLIKDIHREGWKKTLQFEDEEDFEENFSEIEPCSSWILVHMGISILGLLLFFFREEIVFFISIWR